MSEREPTNALLERALNGDKQAFGELCNEHRERVWRTVASVASGPDADDLAQEAIIRAFCSLRRFRGEASFCSWLCKIALNVARDYQRSAWKRRVLLWNRPLEPEGQSLHPENALVEQERIRRVRAAVIRLPEKQRVPLWLHYFEGISITDIARLEGAPESTVRSRMRAGMNQLSEQLQDLLPAQNESAVSWEPDPSGVKL